MKRVISCNHNQADSLLSVRPLIFCKFDKSSSGYRISYGSLEWLVYSGALVLFDGYTVYGPFPKGSIVRRSQLLESHAILGRCATLAEAEDIILSRIAKSNN